MFIDKATQTNGPHQTLNITGLACAKGYTGKPKPMCTKAAGAYSVSGCTKVSTYKKVQPTYKLMPAADGRCNDDASLISSFDDCQAALNAIKKKRNDVRNVRLVQGSLGPLSLFEGDLERLLGPLDLCRRW